MSATVPTISPISPNSASTQLAKALIASAALSGLHIEIIGHHTQAWNTAIFTGARHALTITVSDDVARDVWLASLPDADWNLVGHLVADVAVVGWRAIEGDVCFIDLEVLTVDER